WMRAVAEWLPLTHSIEAFRLALLENASPAILRADLTFLAWAGLALMTAGYVTFQSVDRFTHRTGSVAHH
ncbi:MAG TPA: hypothetical protein VFH67_07500, partial [bacterium]|nr:hypothetical protein [bacterium]